MPHRPCGTEKRLPTLLFGNRLSIFGETLLVKNERAKIQINTDTLDMVLFDMYNKRTRYSIHEIDNLLYPNLSHDVRRDVDGRIIFDKLEKDGHITKKHQREGQSSFEYYISLDGIVFVENSLYEGRPYYSERRRETIKNTWVKIKITAAVLNAIIIILIAAWGVIVQMQANEKSDNKEQPINRIDLNFNKDKP